MGTVIAGPKWRERRPRVLGHQTCSIVVNPRQAKLQLTIETTRPAIPNTHLGYTS
jgi:hypothetical protein